MVCWYLLLFALLQAPIDSPIDTAPARDVELPGVLTERIPLSKLRQRIADDDYALVPRSQLYDLFRRDHDDGPGTTLRPQIREAHYAASLNGTRLDQGRLKFDIYPASSSLGKNPLLIGQTNLQQLKISDQQGKIELGSDSSRRLFLLKPNLSEKLTGTWTSDGFVTGEVVTFRLELPAATTNQFELLTKPGIIVTSVGGLVLGPEFQTSTSDVSATDTGQLAKWTILPGDASHLTFSCREQRLLQPLDPMPLASFNASHVLDVLSGDILNSRWTIGLPAELNGRVRLTARISSRVRVAAVLLEDKRPVEWRVSEEDGQHVLNLLLPAASESATLTVFAASVLPQSESWDLPMLSFDQWFGRNDEQHGPILVPVGQVSVLLPAAVHLDEWTLVGLQERDIVTGPNQSREYQLTQFLPEASAIARTSTSEPRLEDAVVTIVEPAGRLATVRCLVNVWCEGASVVELQWPVSQGWQVIAARYASDSRALFFEFTKPNPEAAASLLTLHLPESLEPRTSRMVEIQFRQSDDADAQNIDLPLAENPGIHRINAIAVFPPALTLSTELQRLWSAGRRTLTQDEVRNSMEWLPESRLPTGGQCFAVGGSESTRLAVATAANLPNSNSVELEHAVRIVEGQIVETSRIVLPANQQFGENLTLMIPTHFSNDSRWSMDGQPVSVKRDEASVEAPDWRRWSLSLAGRRPDVVTVLRCESRQPAGQELNATIPMPVTNLPVRGILQLFPSDEGQLIAPGLTRTNVDNSVETIADDQMTAWTLPVDPAIVSLVLGQNPGIHRGQMIDIHMLHLIDEQSGRLHQHVLAVADISRSAGQNTLPLALSAGVRPLVLVNGHRVQLQDSTAGLAIPLPASSVDCQVVVMWIEPSERPASAASNRELPRLFVRELSALQCTHHFLVSRQLELRATETVFAAEDSTDVMHVLDRLMLVSRSTGGESGPIATTNVPTEIRSFISHWQLSTLQNWQQRTLIDTVTSESLIVVHVSQPRRRVAIAIGTALLLVAMCSVWRQTVLEFRLGISLAAVSLLAIHFLMTVSAAAAILSGAFWGLLIGLTVVTLTEWKWFRILSRQTFVRTTAAAVTLFIISYPCSGQQTTGKQSDDSQVSTAKGLQRSEMQPDVLLPEGQLLDNSVAYVRKSVLEKWQKRVTVEQSTLPAAVVTSLHTEIIADSVESVELLLKLEVAAVSGDEVCHFRIPLQGSRLVRCTIDGDLVLPEPDGLNAIRIPIPGSSLLPTRELAGFADDDRNTADDRTAAADAGGAAVDAGPRAAFTLHQIECRLRPVTTRQASGLQFRLPALPCPVAEIKVSAPEGLFTGVRAQSSAGVVQWKPNESPAQLSSLAMSEGIDVRLFQSGVQKGSPQLATVDMLTIAEIVGEQPVLSCFCRFSRWNPLTPEVRYYVPQGYQLVSVNSVNGGELLWSTRERIATILLPNAIGDEFLLSLQLNAIASSPLQQRRIPIAELIQFADCVVSPNLLLSVRVNPVFSVLAPEGNQVKTLAFADAQPVWRQWLKPSDSVFTVPSGIPECVVRLTARDSLNEVRYSQNFAIQNQRIDWKCQIDIDTSILPVFRHRLTVNSDIEITDVQVTAGESNRLETWHRRGDRLVVQLKEGTTGWHILKISGRQLLRPDDRLISLHSPHVHNSHFLDSVVELVDLNGLGLAFERLGSAVPNDRIVRNDLLLPGVPVRMQILEESGTSEESDPVVLQRLKPVEPVGSIAVLRSIDRAAIVVHLSQWSGSLGPLEMNFAEDSGLLTEPSVLVDGRLFKLIREGNRYVAGRDVIRELFDQPDFSIVWSMPIPESQRAEESITFAWPEISDRIQWTGHLLIPLDTMPGAIDTSVAPRLVPPWLIESSSLGFGNDLSALNVKLIDPAVELSGSGRQLIVPLNNFVAAPETEVVRTLFAVSDSVLWTSPGQSAVGQTTLIVFTARPHGRCTLIIPNGTVVTELETAEATRWEDAGRREVTLRLTKPMTVIKIRWMSEQAKNGFISTTLHFAPPFPANCETRRSVTIASSESEIPQFLGEVRAASAADLNEVLSAELIAGLTRSQPDENAVDASTEPLPTSDELAAQLSSLREEFIRGFTGPSKSTVIRASCRPVSNVQIEVFSRNRLQWPTVVSIAAGFLAVAGAAFGQTMRSEISEPLTRIATQSSDSRQSGSKSQTSAGGQPPIDESASANTTRQPQS